MYTEEYFKQIIEEEEGQADRLASYLISTYQPKSVVDFGCANGLYLEPFYNTGNIHVLGLDYSAEAVKMAKIPNIVLTDLRQPYNTVSKFDLALCIEVLEHIEEEYADIVVENIINSSDIVIISPATIGQGGVGHVNLQYKKYWKEKFEKEGFQYMEKETKKLVDFMKSGYHMGWLVNNVMIFWRKQ